MSIKYYYKAQNTDLWIDITNCITEHASGDQEINNTSLNFKFKLYPINAEIDPNIGDDILIVENNENIIACGYIFDNGRELIGFDKDLSQAICKFNITCLERDFSSYPINTLSFTQTNLSVILDEFMLYTDDSISYNSQKYQVKFSDIEIDALTVEKKTVREALTDLCDQIDSFWIMKYVLESDDTNVWNVYRYIEIYDKNGLTLDSSSIWNEGIQNKHLKGTITNPITANIDRIPTVPDIKSVDIKSDPSVIINYLELACKIYASGNDTDLERRNIPAVLGQSDYDLFDYASDIIYVAFGINTNILSGATNVIIPIPSKDAVTIEAGNIARFPDNDPDNFYEVITVSKINTTKTNIYFDPPLSFTPAVGQSFEIVSNVPIYRSEKEVDYSDKGVLIDTTKTSTAKLKFLDLSEPPPGINIIVYYKKIKNYAFKVINDESKGVYGLKYKQFTIDDDIVLTQDELNNLSSKLLILNPVYKFTTQLYRYGLPQIGMATSVNIDGYITENFILNSMEWQIIGNDDPNEMPIIEKTLDFSTYIGDPQRVIDRFVRSKRKATAISGELDQIRKQVEKIKVIENVTWSLNAPNTLDAPIAVTATDINNDGFKANYTPVSGAVTHKLDVSIYEDFRACVSGYNNKNILRSGYWVVNGLHEITGTDIFYYRFRARSSDGITSLNSNTITVNRASLTEERILYMKSVSSIFQIFSSKLDSTDEQQHTSTISVINDAVYLPNGDIVFSKNTGTEYKLFRINKDESYATEHELLNDSDNPLILNNYYLGSSNDGNYLAYIKESPPSTSNLYEYNINTRVESQLTSGDPPFSYSPQYDRTDENIYYSSGTFASTLYINKYNRGLASNTILNTVSKSLFNAVDSDNNYLYYGQFSTFPNLIIKKFDLATEVSTDIVTTGNTYFNNIFLNFDENKLYFSNVRSPHSGQWKIYRCNLDGSSQEILIGGSDSENYLICDVKKVSF